MRLARLLAQRRYDLVNAYGFKASMIARVLVRVCRLRTVVVCGVQGLHVTDLEDLASRKSRVARHLERLLSPLVDVYDVNSPGALRLLADSGISESKLRYVPHGIDVQWWERRPARSHGGIPTILCTARFVARKRQDDLVRAIAVLLERGIECHAVLAGEGPTRAACRRLAKELGVADLIDFPGSVSPAKARELMDEASVFCLPSTWEGMPTVILEAMARGVPVVGTAVNGTGDLVVDGQTGRTVPAKDPGRLAEALESVLTAPAQAARFATEARRMVEREHTVERMAELKRSLYFELLGLRPSPTSP
jgi:glycosyltransferase involved in cell wall biosynthesis